jgi:hypothetical protein
MADRIDDVNNSGSSSSPSNVVDQDTAFLRDGGSNSGSKKRKLDAAPADAPANACRLHPYMNAESSIKKLKTSKKSNTEEDGDDGDDGGDDSILCVDCKKPFPTLERNRECTNPSCKKTRKRAKGGALIVHSSLVVSHASGLRVHGTLSFAARNARKAT